MAGRSGASGRTRQAIRWGFRLRSTGPCACNPRATANYRPARESRSARPRKPAAQHPAEAAPTRARPARTRSLPRCIDRLKRCVRCVHLRWLRSIRRSRRSRRCPLSRAAYARFRVRSGECVQDLGLGIGLLEGTEPTKADRLSTVVGEPDANATFGEECVAANQRRGRPSSLDYGTVEQVGADMRVHRQRMEDTQVVLC